MMKDNGAPVIHLGVITHNGRGDEVTAPSDRNGEKFGRTILNFIFCLTLDSMVPSISRKHKWGRKLLTTYRKHRFVCLTEG